MINISLRKLIRKYINSKFCVTKTYVLFPKQYVYRVNTNYGKFVYYSLINIYYVIVASKAYRFDNFKNFYLFHKSLEKNCMFV